jgi:hypothetical protein
MIPSFDAGHRRERLQKAVLHGARDQPIVIDVASSRLLLDQVASKHPAVRVIGSGNPEPTGAMLGRILNKNRDAVERYLEDRGEIVDPERPSAMARPSNRPWRGWPMRDFMAPPEWHSRQGHKRAGA